MKRLILIIVTMLLISKGDNSWANIKEKDIRKVEVTRPSGISLDELEHVLKATSLKSEAESFYEMERKTGTNAVFAIAVASLEAGIDRGIVDNKNNYFGLMYGGEKIYFDSARDSIMSFGKTVQKKIYQDKTIEEFARIYCPPNADFWANFVSGKYSEIISRLDNMGRHNISKWVYNLKMESSILI
ncbi:MAG: hypothetical protein MR314_02180 [Ezakiella sp.]|nr:hypothetical protein [Ezakiella sp.]